MNFTFLPFLIPGWMKELEMRASRETGGGGQPAPGTPNYPSLTKSVSLKASS